ncbi:unnamed protein product [Schistosoma mattheei]|uniref:Calcineurin-like phosphoesterase domain-containing protein n=1 Tax=Schistosoma mattheei TaxID=31246 RepID=A0A3P8AND0_9TREM|nr:unnamed protein product [Schistosoma mattheei]
MDAIYLIIFNHIFKLQNDRTTHLKHLDWQMKRAFQASLYLHNPNAVIILGDILDEGKWATNDDFSYLVGRFRDIFHHDKTKTLVKTVVGNHDIGFHYACVSYNSCQLCSHCFKSNAPCIQTTNPFNFYWYENTLNMTICLY